MRQRILRITAALIVLLMLTGSLTALAQTLSFTDVAGKPCREAVEVLAALGVVEGRGQADVFAPDNPLTRAEAAALISKLMGVYESGRGREIFSDVTADHWAYDVVTPTYDMGIIGGVGDGLFEPDEPLLYVQAVKMVVCMLGYGVSAEHTGGYPAGYLTKATQIGLLDGIAPTEDSMTRGGMAQLLYNSLDISPMDRKSHGPGQNETYAVDEDTTFLALYKGVLMKKGIVTNTYTISLAAQSRSLDRDEVAIGNLIFSVGDTKLGGWIGRKVKVYYTEEDGKLQAVAAVQAANTEATTILAADITDKTTASTIVYDTGEKLKSISIGNASLAINGQVKAPYTAADLQADEGSVTIIQNGGSDAVVLMDVYETYVVDYAGADAIYYMDNTNGRQFQTLESSKQNKVVLCEADGTEISADKLAKWNVLSVTTTEGLTKIIRCADRVTGKITELSADTVVIDGRYYRITKTVHPSLSVGGRATFYLNHLGYVAAADTTESTSYHYGYLVGAAGGKGLDAQPQFKIFTEESEMTTFETTERVKLNGVNTARGALLPATGSNELCNNGAFVRQLLRYETNEAGDLITAIETASDAEGAEPNGFRKDLYIPEDGKINGETVSFKAGSLRMFAGNILLREKSKIFCIPAADKEDDSYTMMKYTELLHDEAGGDYTNVTFYDVDENRIAGAMVWDMGGTTVSSIPLFGDTQALITNISTIYEDETGANIKQLTVMTPQQTTVTLPIEDDFKVFFKCAITANDPAVVITDSDGYTKIYARDLKVGDVIQYNSKGGKVAVLNVLFRAETPGQWDTYWGLFNDPRAPWKTTAVKNYGSLMQAFATVERIGTQGIIATVKDRNNPGVTYTRVYPVISNSSSAILRFDMKTKTVSAITAARIEPGDKIFVSWYTNLPRFIILYENMQTD